MLPPAQRALWPRLVDLPGPFVLYGGTAVALRCGHRASEDFDFFSAEALKPEALLRQVPWLRKPEPRILQREDNTLSVEISGAEGTVKLSFFGTIGFGQVQPPDQCTDNGLKIASAADLLALKLAVIHERVEAKDYLDVCALLRAGLSLADGLSHLEALHPLATNAMIVLKTLTYFKGGDLATLPDDVKRDLETAVSRVREVPPFTGTKSPIGSG
ncbi:MAG: nucleotidyl transferase AbiEii/AbiGii toxin family protein [Opitutaceae bacterium]|nr:nucleotidyl transferase AbiEii/AbiGii toxin family protein [Opitutaceae bacterium]